MHGHGNVGLRSNAQQGLLTPVLPKALMHVHHITSLRKQQMDHAAFTHVCHLCAQVYIAACTAVVGNTPLYPHASLSCIMNALCPQCQGWFMGSAFTSLAQGLRRTLSELVAQHRVLLRAAVVGSC